MSSCHFQAVGRRLKVSHFGSLVVWFRRNSCKLEQNDHMEHDGTLSFNWFHQAKINNTTSTTQRNLYSSLGGWVVETNARGNLDVISILQTWTILMRPNIDGMDVFMPLPAPLKLVWWKSETLLYPHDLAGLMYAWWLLDTFWIERYNTSACVFHAKLAAFQLNWQVVASNVSKCTAGFHSSTCSWWN